MTNNKQQPQQENPNNQFSNSEPMTFAQKVEYVKSTEMTNNKQQTEMNKEFVPYELALELKQLGFDEKCFCNWEESWSPEPEHEIRMILTTDQTWLRPGWVRAPTFSQAFRWFRENHDLRIWIESNYGVLKFEYVIATSNPNFIDKQFSDFSGYKTYEEAELACLIKLIEIVKTKQQ
jgi:hypothetical protein